MFFTTRRILTLFLVLAVTTQVFGVPVPGRGDGKAGKASKVDDTDKTTVSKGVRHGSGSVSKHTESNTASRGHCRRSGKGKGKGSCSSNGSRKSITPKAPECPANLHKNHPKRRDGLGSEMLSRRTIERRAPKVFKIQIGSQEHQGRYEDCYIGVGGEAAVYPILEWTPPDAAGIPTDVTWVLKAFEDVPKKEALEAERTAAKLLRKYGGEGRASSNAGLDEFSLIVARGIGEPLDKNPNAPANLEALVPSAAAVVQEYAKLGWLHNDLHTGNFMVNAEGTEVTDAVDLGVGIFKDSKYASLSKPSDSVGHFAEFTTDLEKIEATIRAKWDLQ